MNKLLEYPNLPMLPMEKCFAVFKAANIPAGKMDKLSGFTRMALYKWQHNKAEALPHSQDRISVLAYKALRAMKDGKAPFQPSAPLEHIKLCLEEGKTPLRDCTPEQLLPSKWLTQITTEA